MSDRFQNIFNNAENFFQQKKYEAALNLFHQLKDQHNFSSFAYLRIGEIANILGDPEYASECFYKAYKIDPAFNKTILPANHPLHSHVYGEMDNRKYENCPLCGEKGIPHWTYPIVVQPNCPKYFNPVRTWLYCEPCHHLFSAEPTDYIEEEAPLLHTSQETTASPRRFALLSTVLNRLRDFSKGNKYLEVGVGEGECIVVARELLFDVTGIDLTKKCVNYVNNTFNLNVIHGDFFEHSFDGSFDIIVMGDVLEHVRNPRAFLEKAADLSHEGTVLWVSTPNFESAFTLWAGHNDPMRKEPAHCGYFSYNSLIKLLDECGFDAIRYDISPFYNGSMEITAIKR